MPPTNFFAIWTTAIGAEGFYVAQMRDNTVIGFRRALDTMITVNDASQSYGLLQNVWSFQLPRGTTQIREFGNILDEQRDIEVRLGDIISLVELDSAEQALPKP